MKKTYLFITILFSCIFIVSPIYTQSNRVKDTIGDSYRDIILMISDAELISYSNPKKCISLANKIISYGEQKNVDWIISKGMFLSGHAYGNLGDFVTGFEYIQNAIDYCPADSLRLKSKIILKKGSFYIYLRELSKAKGIANDALDIALQLNDSLLVATCYNTIGLINIHIPDREIAELNFMKAYEINKSIGYKRGMAKNLNNLGLYKGENLEDKINQINQAIQINSVKNEYWALAENYNNLGRQYYFWNKYNESITALNTARKYAQNINARELLQDNNRYFADLYEKMGKYQLAFEYTKLVLDEVENGKMADRIRVYQSKILQKTIERKEKSIIEQKQQYHITLMKYVIAIILLLFISLVCAVAYMYNRMKHKSTIVEAENANKELHNIKEQLTNTAVLVRSRGEMLNNIQAQIKDSFKLPESERIEKLHSISRSISSFNSKDNEMELLVDKVSSDFINELSKKYPDLTQNEKRLASLLKIGLSSKEIANIISSQPKSVDMARYRLRKKLNLETDDKLQECLSKI